MADTIVVFGGLFITLVVELVVVWLFIRKNFYSILWSVVLVNLFSWPIAQIFYSGGAGMFFIIEAGVAIAESVLLML